MNIAIVDDSESDRQLLQELLIRYFDISGISITIYPFQSGELFLAGLSHHSFDLVFLDIFMDEITGMDAAHKFRSRLRLHNYFFNVQPRICTRRIRSRGFSLFA